MGNICAADIYKQIKDKYKNQFVKFVVSKNTTNMLDRIVQKSKIQLKQNLNEVKDDKLKAIDHAQTQITQHYTTNRKLLQEKIPGDIKSLQRVKKAKIQDLMGYTYYRQKIAQLKLDTNEKITNISKQLLVEIDRIYKYQRSKLAQDEPDLVLFNQLKPQIQKSVFSRGLSQYNQQVVKSQNYLRKTIQPKLDPQFHTSRVKNILPQQSLDGLVSLAKQKFQNSVDLLSSGPLKDLNKII